MDGSHSRIEGEKRREKRMADQILKAKKGKPWWEEDRKPSPIKKALTHDGNHMEVTDKRKTYYAPFSLQQVLEDQRRIMREQTRFLKEQTRQAKEMKRQTNFIAIIFVLFMIVVVLGVVAFIKIDENNLIGQILYYLKLVRQTCGTPPAWG